MAEETDVLAQVLARRFDDYVHFHEKEHNLRDVAAMAAKEANDLRIERLNELRGDVEKDRIQFQKADSAEIVRLRTEERLGALERAEASQRGANIAWTAAIAVFFTIVQIALRFI